MAARPSFIDPRGIEDLWRDVDATLARLGRSRNWLARRMGVDAGALSRMANGLTHTPVDLAFAIAAEVGPHVLDSLGERSGLEVSRADLSRWTTREDDARRVLVRTGGTVSTLAEALADNEITDQELADMRPDLQALHDEISALLARGRSARVVA